MSLRNWWDVKETWYMKDDYRERNMVMEEREKEGMLEVMSDKDGRETRNM